jgi:type III secretion system FlhB-like substrate exporter
MQRREFLQSTLALGAAGMLIPDVEPAGGHELSPSLEITKKMETLIEEEMEEYNRRAGHFKGTEEVRVFSSEIAPQSFRLDGTIILISRQGVTVALKYDAKTMIAPVVLAKGDCRLTKRLLETGTYEFFVKSSLSDRLQPTIDLFGEQFFHLKSLRWGFIVEQEEFVVQDIFDNVNVGNAIPERHYECITNILERDALAERRLFEKEFGWVTEEEIYNLAREAVENFERNNPLS